MIARQLYKEDLGYADGLKIIHKVIIQGNPHLLRAFLKLNLDVNMNTDKGDKFLPEIKGLHLIALMEKWELIDVLLEYRSINLSTTDEYLNTILHYVSLFNKQDVMDKLLAMQINISQRNFEGDEVIHTCTYNDSYECFITILNKYSRPEGHEEIIVGKRNNKNENCIHLSIVHRAVNIFKYILSIVKKIDSIDDN